MKNYIAVILIFYFFNTCSFSQSKSKLNACTFLDVSYKGSVEVFEKPGGKSLICINNDIDSSDYMQFLITDKNDSMFFVNVNHAIDGSFITKGWIRKTNSIGIYSSVYDKELKLYESPNKNSKVQCIVKEYSPEMYIVKDCVDNWLLVEITLNGIKYLGWMSPDMQCCNVFSTCS